MADIVFDRKVEGETKRKTKSYCKRSSTKRSFEKELQLKEISNNTLAVAEVGKK
jgi:hypothetical protein